MNERERTEVKEREISVKDDKWWWPELGKLKWGQKDLNGFLKILR